MSEINGSIIYNQTTYLNQTNITYVSPVDATHSTSDSSDMTKIVIVICVVAFIGIIILIIVGYRIKIRKMRAKTSMYNAKIVKTHISEYDVKTIKLRSVKTSSQKNFSRFKLRSRSPKKPPTDLGKLILNKLISAKSGFISSNHTPNKDIFIDVNGIDFSPMDREYIYPNKMNLDLFFSKSKTNKNLKTIKDKDNSNQIDSSASCLNSVESTSFNKIEIKRKKIKINTAKHKLNFDHLSFMNGLKINQNQKENNFDLNLENEENKCNSIDDDKIKEEENVGSLNNILKLDTKFCKKLNNKRELMYKILTTNENMKNLNEA